jgi:hypothetical protein
MSRQQPIGLDWNPLNCSQCGAYASKPRTTLANAICQASSWPAVTPATTSLASFKSFVRAPMSQLVTILCALFSFFQRSVSVSTRNAAECALPAASGPKFVVLPTRAEHGDPSHFLQRTLLPLSTDSFRRHGRLCMQPHWWTLLERGSCSVHEPGHARSGAGEHLNPKCHTTTIRSLGHCRAHYATNCAPTRPQSTFFAGRVHLGRRIWTGRSVRCAKAARISCSRRPMADPRI